MHKCPLCNRDCDCGGHDGWVDEFEDPVEDCVHDCDPADLKEDAGDQ